MHRFWSLLFATVNLACLALLVVAYACPELGWWLPDAASTQATNIDSLFYLITALCGFFFVATEGILIYSLWKFPSTAPGNPKPIHGHLGLEIGWTIAPLVGLLVITAASLPVWQAARYQGLPTSTLPGNSETPPDADQVILVTARQWDWHLKYATEPLPSEGIRQWAAEGTPSDLVVANELHVWKGAKVSLLLRTTDVIHSFFVPALRLKQDTLPGKTIPMRFEATVSNVRFDPAEGRVVPTDTKASWEIACAELCGGNHFRMRGKLFVHPDRKSYDAWLDHSKRQTRSRSLTAMVPQAASSIKKDGFTQ